MDFAEAGLLDGLNGEERAARIRLLESLVADGVELEELRRAVQEDRLALLPVERVLAGKYSAAEVETETGLPAATLLAVRRALGCPRPAPRRSLHRGRSRGRTVDQDVPRGWLHRGGLD